VRPFDHLTLLIASVETSHQTVELIKTIVGRIAKAKPDLSRSPDLESTLQDIDKFARRAGINYRTRLSDDVLSELADILDPFDLGLGDDEVQFVREQKTAESSSSRDRDFKPLPPATPASAPAVRKNAFAEMMRSAGAKPVSKASSSSQPISKQLSKATASTPTSSKPKPKPIDLEDYENDDFFDKLAASDLDMIENRAKRTIDMPKTARPPPVAAIRHQQTPAAQKLNINVVPRKPVQSTSTSSGRFKSKFMQEMRREHKFGQAERNRAPIGGVVPKLPQASALGSGLGAYTGPPRSIKPMPDSGSSASESSDEENKGIKALVKRQKSPVKKVAEQPRTIKILGSAMDDLMRSREEKRAAQHRIKQRLRPDVSALHRYVLSWDPQHVGPKPPHHPRFAAECSKLGPVPATFNGAKQYEQVMLPLFLQELWAQTQQEKPSSDMPMLVEISTRAYEDDFLDIDVFSKQMYGTFVTDSDVVVLSQPGKPVRPVMAKVQAFKKRQNIATIKLRILALNDQKELSAKGVWQMTKHFS
jgi:senataxin